jgi:glycosyltransferase involved in cell wall biosynthesis
VRGGDAALVAALSMAGVPTGSEVDLADPVAREEHSVVQRREALRTWSTAAWRRRAAERAGVRLARDPSVSVVLATRRPEMLGFALRQVRRQAGVDLQLVLAAHGFEPDASVVAEHGPERVVVRAQPAEMPFGDVLNAGVEAADGDLVLKMDDDDWYGRDFVADLLLARSYSGAEMVGTPAEFHYLVEKDVTVRRGHQVELYAPFVAGGTMLVERGLLREVGGFRSVRRFVDAQLIAAVQRAGAATYRTHGLGYLLRRNASGHTWQVDDDYLLDPTRVAEIRPGFAPSRLLDVDPTDRP